MTDTTPPTPGMTVSTLAESLLSLTTPATILFLGDVDTGKTTAVRTVVTQAVGAGRTVAVIDCDTGQSEIGPPGTVGVALATPENWSAGKNLRDLTPLASYFVGATSPVRHLLDLCVGTSQMLQIAHRHSPDLILIDPCGLVHGNAGRQLVRRTAEIVAPHVIAALARGDELEPLLALFAHLKRPEVWRVGVDAAVGRKTSASRSTRRAARFLAAFDGARDILVSLDDVVLVGTWLGTGTPLPRHLQQFLSESLRLPVLHAERQATGALYVVVNGERWDTSGLAAIESYFKTSAITVAPARKFAHLLVGLIDANGVLMDLGTIERIDFGKRLVTLLTPCRRPAAIAQVWLGALRLKPDGKELGEVRPGEV